MADRNQPRADYGIVTALRDELTALKTALGSVEELNLGREDIRTYYRARLRCEDATEVTVICACATEMGQVPAANLTRDLVTSWEPQHLLSVGIAGGLRERGASYGDIVAPLRVHYYEPGKLVPGGESSECGRTERVPRPRTLPTSARLSSAIEAVATGNGAWLRRIATPRPDGSSGTTRVLRGELATGEEVWGSLQTPTVKEVLAYSDKILAIETEAYGFLSAVQESPVPPDAVIVKALSDLVEGKDDRWRCFAANAAAAFAIGLIERTGSRWLSGRPAPEARLGETTVLPRAREAAARSLESVVRAAGPAEFVAEPTLRLMLDESHAEDVQLQELVAKHLV